MNLSKLFEIQRVLDERIMDEHPELKGQDNLDWKVLALQVELGECANEWRGFKKWSHDQVPRVRVMKPDTWENLGCPTTEEELNAIDDKYWTKPLLGEYVDCLHLILTIGLEIGVKDVNPVLNQKTDVMKLFSSCFTWVEFLPGSADKRSKEKFFSSLVGNFLALGKALGFTWDQIEQAYLEKNVINHKRQEEGY